MFGGGQFSSYDHILRYDPTSGVVAQVGTLPVAASDVAVTSLGDTAYVVGGYDGARALDTVIAWRPGTPPRVAGHTPRGVRYAAVAALGGRLIIAGGTVSGGATDLILSFDPRSGAVSPIGRLPTPLTHATAVVFHGRVLLIGGRRTAADERSSAILSIDPASGQTQTVGHLPHPMSDAMAAASGSQVILAGGETATGPLSSLLRLSAG